VKRASTNYCVDLVEDVLDCYDEVPDQVPEFWTKT